MTKRTIGIVLFAALIGTPAVAADMAVKAPPPPPLAPIYSWTGWYVGGQIGLVTSTMSADPWSDADFSGTVVVRGDMVQTLAGIHAGYNYQFYSNLVAGIEGDINGRFGEGFFPATDLLMRSTWDASLRARLGILVTPRSLLYATGGVAFGDFKTTAASGPVESNFDLLAGTRVGWTAGGGIQYALDGNWSSRLEYRYTDWGSKTVAWVNESGDPVVARSTLRDQRIEVGLSYKFGGPADPFAGAPSAMPVKAPLKAPPPAVMASWTGFYIGGHVGSSAAKMKAETAPFTEVEDGETTTFQATSGGFTQVLAGVHGGYNYQFTNNLVAGVEADVNAKFGGGTLFKVKSIPTSDWDGSIRGRLGMLVTPRSLVYATGGFAFGHFTTPLHETDTSGDAVELLGGDRTGWTLGAGIEYALDGGWNTRIEYRYTDWGSKAVQWEDHPATSTLTDSRVIAGLTYKVGGATKVADRNAVPMNWNGFYAGGQVGASAAKSQFGPNPDDTEPEFSQFTQLLVGGHAGYNYQFNLFVVGVEGDLNAKLGNGFKIDDQLRPTSSWDASIRGRIGVAVSPEGLVYFTGGYAWGNFTTPLSNADAGDQDGEHLGGSRQGWTLGGGIQYALDQNWSARIEYRHTDWGTKMTDAAFDLNPASLKDNRVAVGMSYKFSDWGNALVRAKY